MIQQDNRFSLNRLGLVANYYRRPVSRQLMLYAIVTAVLFLLCSLALDSMLHAMAASFTSLVVMLLFMLGPVAFADEHSRQVTVLLPARASERFTFILFHTFVAVPLVIFAVWTVLWGATCMFDWSSPFWEVWSPTDYESTKQLPMLGDFLILFCAAQYLVPTVIVLWVVLACRTSITTKAILATFGSLIGLSIVGMIIGLAAVAIMVYKFKDQIAEWEVSGMNAPDVLRMLDEGSHGFITLAFVTLTVILIVFIVFVLWRCYRQVAYKQI